MQIEEQIKTLLKLKAEIDLYRKLDASIEAELDTKLQHEEHKTFERDYPGVLEKFCNDVRAFCAEKIEELGNPKPEVKETISVNGGLTTAQPKPVPQLVDDHGEPTDPIKFLLKYRHFDSKRVIVDTPNGRVGGVVRGLVTPFIIVAVDTGHEVKIPPKDITLE